MINQGLCAGSLPRVLHICFNGHLARSRAMFSNGTKTRERVDKGLLSVAANETLSGTLTESEGPGRAGDPVGQTSCLPSTI